MRQSLEPMAAVCFTCFPFVSVRLYCGYLIPFPPILVVQEGRQLGNYKNPYPILIEGTHATQMSWTFKLHALTRWGIFKVFLWERANGFYVKRAHWGGRKVAGTAVHQCLSSLSLHASFSWAHGHPARVTLLAPLKLGMATWPSPTNSSGKKWCLLFWVMSFKGMYVYVCLLPFSLPTGWIQIWWWLAKQPP